ncbi:hypothetical protein GOODEAATRI_031325 [Goodea atripinnis]|uniref:Uncharacterized protein n=1 Tax=Goodea atripinnis TaxID=208336 RepID=A0ABV0MWP0_9TELE
MNYGAGLRGMYVGGWTGFAWFLSQKGGGFSSSQLEKESRNFTWNLRRGNQHKQGINRAVTGLETGENEEKPSISEKIVIFGLLQNVQVEIMKYPLSSLNDSFRGFKMVNFIFELGLFSA